MKLANLFAADNFSNILLIVLLAVMVIVIIVLPMFTNKKRQKQVSDLQNSVKVGDTIKTVGGIIGKVVEVRGISAVDKEMVIETGYAENKTTMVFDIQAVYQVMSAAPTAETVETKAETAAESKTDVFEETKAQPAPVEEPVASVAPVAEKSESEEVKEVAETAASADEAAVADKPATTPAANKTKSASKSTSSKSAKKKS